MLASNKNILHFKLLQYIETRSKETTTHLLLMKFVRSMKKGFGRRGSC